jgi:hypothetical protein
MCLPQEEPQRGKIEFWTPSYASVIGAAMVGFLAGSWLGVHSAIRTVKEMLAAKDRHLQASGAPLQPLQLPHVLLKVHLTAQGRDGRERNSESNLVLSVDMAIYSALLRLQSYGSSSRVQQLVTQWPWCMRARI